jgi:TatD DNase family protein
MTGGIPPLLDSHCHLTEAVYSGREEVYLKRARDAGVRWIVSVGTDLDTSRRAVEQAARYGNVFATAGIHPHEAKHWSRDSLGALRELCTEWRVVAVGEAGLDYHYEFSPRELQREVFGEQVELAVLLGLPLVIHTREAVEDAIDIVRERGGGKARGVFHCFSGTASQAQEIVGLGFSLSFAGNVTYRKFDGSGICAVPPERLLVETDSPYLAPVPHRGKTNEPAFLPLVLGGFMRFLGNITIEKLAAVTTRNAVRLFGIEKELGSELLDLLHEGVK